MNISPVVAKPSPVTEKSCKMGAVAGATVGAGYVLKNAKPALSSIFEANKNSFLEGAKAFIADQGLANADDVFAKLKEGASSFTKKDKFAEVAKQATDIIDDAAKRINIKETLNRASEAASKIVRKDKLSKFVLPSLGVIAAITVGGAFVGECIGKITQKVSECFTKKTIAETVQKQIGEKDIATMSIDDFEAMLTKSE